MNNREYDILEHILQYCQEINETVARFGNSYEVFSQDRDYKNSIALSVLQIGELSTHLSDDFQALYPDIPWKDIRGMRNIVAHHYGKMDTGILFEIVKNNIPELERQIDAMLLEAQLSNDVAQSDDAGPEMTL